MPETVHLVKYHFRRTQWVRIQHEKLSRWELVQSSGTVYEIAPRLSQPYNTKYVLTLDSKIFPHSLSNKLNEAMSLTSRAKHAQQEHCPLLSLSAELRNMIYEYAFEVDHI
jgi:hypothetical protein